MANIAFLLNQFPAGGVERVTMNLIPSLTRDKGHNVFIFVNRLDNEHLANLNLQVTYIPIPHEAWDKKNEAAVVEGIKKHGIELLFVPVICPKYIFHIKELELCKICFVAHSAPFYELKEIRNTITRKWLLNKGLKAFKKPFIKTLKLKLGYYDRRLKSRYRRRYDKLDAFGVLFERYGEVIAKKIGVNYPDSKIFTLQNPFSQTSNVEFSAQRKKRIIFVGRLTYSDKRIDRLLKVWEIVCDRFSEWELTIIGDGPEEHSLQQYVIKHNLPRVEFVPFTATPELYYKESEILCLTSDFEGCPMVLLEAQQYGCATIAFDCSYGVRDILSPNWENGVYVPNGDVEAYTNALSRLIEDEELRHKIQKNGIENVKRFSIERSVEYYDTLINKLCSK